MEVWALEAYGAAFILQELLNREVRRRVWPHQDYEAIVKGEAAMEPGAAGIVQRLIRELQSLCLDVELIKAGEEEAGVSGSGLKEIGG